MLPSDDARARVAAWFLLMLALFGADAIGSLFESKSGDSSDPRQAEQPVSSDVELLHSFRVRIAVPIRVSDKR